MGAIALNVLANDNASFIGTDDLTYTVKDDRGEISDLATVTILPVTHP